MKAIVSVVSFAVAAMILGGCQAVPYQPYARQVKVKPKVGGVVALKLNHRDEDRAKAEGMMARTCPDKSFEILEEGEVVIGTETNSRTSQNNGSEGVQVGSLFGIPVTSGSEDPSRSTASTTMQKKEWQIKYECEQVAKGKSSKKSTIQ